MRRTSTRRLRARFRTIGGTAFAFFVAFSLPGLLLGYEAAAFRDLSGWVALAALVVSAASFAAAAAMTYLMRRQRRKLQDDDASRDPARA